MSTRSRIGIVNDDGTITSIYCHNDGYPDGAGTTLLQHYTEPTKIRALMGLGDISSLGEEIGQKHDFNRCPRTSCNAYGRDRGEHHTEAATHGSDPWPDTGADYHYLWTGEAWQVRSTHGGAPWAALADRLAETDEEEA